jgi:hypothetical protein
MGWILIRRPVPSVIPDNYEEDRILRAVLVGMLRESGRLTKEGRQTDRIPSYMGNRSREPGSGFGLSEQDRDQQKEGRHPLIS